MKNKLLIDSKFDKLNKFNFKVSFRFKLFRKLFHFLNYTILFLSTTIVISAVIFLFAYIFIHGLIHFNAKLWFKPYNNAELLHSHTTGIQGPLISTLLIIVLVFVISCPISFIFSIWLAEYGKNKWWQKFIINFCIMCNSIPSIVFGIFGMLFFVTLFHPHNVRFSILASACTLSLVIMPMILIGSFNAIAAVPAQLKCESYVLGLNRLQTFWKLILPFAIQGVLDVIILSLIRAIGESAPVLFTIGGYNGVPHSALDMGNTLTLLLFQQFQTNDAENFLFQIAISIFFLILIINVFIIFLKFLFKKQSNNNNRFLKNIMKYFSIEFYINEMNFFCQKIFYFLKHFFWIRKIKI